MNILIKSATIIDPSSDFHNTTQDILIENGTIASIGSNLENTKGYSEITFENLHISQGWFDSSVCFGEPGYEERETIANGLKTAALSGFTAVALNPNTNPVIDTSADVAYLINKAQNHAVDLLVIGALTLGSKGVHLAELFDMRNAGAIAFYDYKNAIANPELLKIAMQYASNFDALVCAYPQNDQIAGAGVMNEHLTSTSLGLKGIANLAEELQVARDLFLLEYTQGKLHIPTISTAKSVELIRAAKAKNLNVTCSVAIHNLYFTDESLTDFNTNFKVLPPLRTQNDVKALINGLKDGTIDMVTSDHNPLDIELKKVEFDHASFGSLGLESAFGALQAIFKLEKTIALLTSGKERFGLTATPIAVGNTINATLFNPIPKYTFSTTYILSKSKNAMFEGQTLKGKVYGIIANNSYYLT